MQCMWFVAWFYFYAIHTYICIANRDEGGCVYGLVWCDINPNKHNNMRISKYMHNIIEGRELISTKEQLIERQLQLAQLIANRSTNRN